MKVVICEDEAGQREFLRECVVSYLEFKGYDMEFGLAAACPDEVLGFIRAEAGPHLYFLDIDILQEGDYNGVNLAADIRKVDPSGFIVFVTSHTHFTSLTFKYRIGALDYLEKTSPEEILEKVRECIDIAYGRYKEVLVKERKLFQFEFLEKEYLVDYDDIAYCTYDSVEREVELFLVQRKKARFKGTLKEIERLDGRFYSCHKGIIINRHNLKKIDKKERLLYLKGGYKVEVSRRRMAELLK